MCDSLREYIESRELHIDARSRLGMELKDYHPKLQERFESYRSIVDSEMSRKLRERQMWDSFFMCAMQKSANFSVPGSGKTASVLGMYAFLRNRGLIKRILVICPKNAFGSWMDEFSVCFKGIETLRVLNIHNPIYKNAKQRNAALQYDSGRCNLVLVNYESVGGVLDSLIQLLDKQTMMRFTLSTATTWFICYNLRTAFIAWAYLIISIRSITTTRFPTRPKRGHGLWVRQSIID